MEAELIARNSDYPKYPWWGVLNSEGFETVVLFLEEEKGIPFYSDNLYNKNRLGQVLTGWEESRFIPFKGELKVKI